jgi:tol-pal system protein YbgF
MRRLLFILPLLLSLWACSTNRLNELDNRNAIEHESMQTTLRLMQTADSLKIEQLQRDMVIHRQALLKYTTDLDALRQQLTALENSPLMQMGAAGIDSLKAQVFYLNKVITEQSDLLKFTSDRITTVLDDATDNTRRVVNLERQFTEQKAKPMISDSLLHALGDGGITKSITRLQSSLESAESSIRTLTTRVNEIGSQLQSIISDPNVKVNPNVKAENYQNQFTEFRTQLTDLREYVKKLETSVSSSLTQKDRTTAELPLVKTEKPLPVQPAKTTPAPAQNTDAEAKAAYEKARKSYESRNLDTAIQQFRELLRRFPGHDLCGNAQYWIGEAYYAAEEYPKAINELNKVVESYPASSKAPDALLKIGLSYLKLDNKQQAKTELEKIRRLYPDYERQSLADKYLNSLK